MTPSLAAVALLAGIAERMSLCLDLGSGFSSYAVRFADVRTVTVDDSTHWLERTGRFLDRARLPRGPLLCNITHVRGLFPVVFYDFGTIDTRIRMLPEAFSRTEAGGVIIVDDMHIDGLRKAATEYASNHGFTPVEPDEVRKLTFDEYKRWIRIFQRDR